MMLWRASAADQRLAAHPHTGAAAEADMHDPKARDKYTHTNVVPQPSFIDGTQVAFLGGGGGSVPDNCRCRIWFGRKDHPSHENHQRINEPEHLKKRVKTCSVAWSEGERFSGGKFNLKNKRESCPQTYRYCISGRSRAFEGVSSHSAYNSRHMAREPARRKCPIPDIRQDREISQ